MDTSLLTLPPWLDAPLAALVRLGRACALIGSGGRAKLSDYFECLRGAPSHFASPIAVFLFLGAPVSAHLPIEAALRMDRSMPSPPPPPSPGPLA
jgi:hypothetical protein